MFFYIEKKIEKIRSSKMKQIDNSNDKDMKIFFKLIFFHFIIQIMSLGIFLQIKKSESYNLIE